MSIDLNNTVALATGANRGIGTAYVEGLLAAGARRVYAAARNPETLPAALRNDSRVLSLALDITDEASVQAAARLASDVTVLVNNAGVIQAQGFLSAPSIEGARNEMEVNYFGVLRMARAFAPLLGANGGGVIVNVLSILARVVSPTSGSYSASKAAGLALTHGLRAELNAQGTQVLAVMPGYVDTDMTAGVDQPKISAADVVEATIAALRNGEEDVYPGELASGVAAALLHNPKAVERQVGQR